MLIYIILLFLSVSIELCAGDAMRVYKTNGIAHIALKIEDDHSAKQGHMIIKFTPAFCKRLSTSQRYIIPFAKPKDLAIWAEYDYLFGDLTRACNDDLTITEKGISILFSQETIDHINKLQRNSRYAVILTASLTEQEVRDEFAQIPPIRVVQPEEQSPIYAIRRKFFSQD